MKDPNKLDQDTVDQLRKQLADANPAKGKELDELVELPEPKRYFGHSTNCPMYTADEMRTYGQACYEAGKQSAAGERVPSPSNWLTGILAKVPTTVLSDSMIRGIEFEAYRAMENDEHRAAAQRRIDSQKSGEDAFPFEIEIYAEEDGMLDVRIFTLTTEGDPSRRLVYNELKLPPGNPNSVNGESNG